MTEDQRTKPVSDKRRALKSFRGTRHRTPRVLGCLVVGLIVFLWGALVLAAYWLRDTTP